MSHSEFSSIESTDSSCELVREVLEAEAAAIRSLSKQLPDSVNLVVDAILECRGKVLVTGMGKMGWVGRKAAATFSSTGTPAVFLHPGEALHGDLGIATDSDLLLALSSSGETDEVIKLVPFMVRHGIPIITITTNAASSLARQSQYVIETGVQAEADVITQAPTTSTTVSLALCDGIAIALMRRRGFTAKEFAIFHPGGHLGRKLLLTVRDLMHSGDRLPRSQSSSTMKQAIVAISAGGLGATLIVNDEGLLAGILTDGDLRRSLESTNNLLNDPVTDHMTDGPVSISESALAAEALRLMEDRSITVLPVVDNLNQPVGMVHLHDLVRVGLA